MGKTTLARRGLVLFALLTANIEAYCQFQSETIRWLAITSICVFWLLITTIYLDEEPLELFDNFGNLKGNETSAIIMIAALISAILMVVSFVK